MSSRYLSSEEESLLVQRFLFHISMPMPHVSMPSHSRRERVSQIDYLSDTATLCSSTRKQSGSLRRMHLLHGNDPEHRTFAILHCWHLKPSPCMLACVHVQTRSDWRRFIMLAYAFGVRLGTRERFIEGGSIFHLLFSSGVSCDGRGRCYGMVCYTMFFLSDK